MAVILFQHRIYRCDLKNNTGVVYLFGDNIARQGLAGQAAEMRGEPNAIGIATKFYPGTHNNDYFSDDHYTQACTIIRADLQRAIALACSERFSNIIVIPSDGLGTGLSALPIRARRVFAYLEACVAALVAGDFLPKVDEAA